MFCFFPAIAYTTRMNISVLKIEAYDTYVNSALRLSPRANQTQKDIISIYKRGVREQVPQTISSYEIGDGYSTVVGRVRRSEWCMPKNGVETVPKNLDLRSIPR